MQCRDGAVSGVMVMVGFTLSDPRASTTRRKQLHENRAIQRKGSKMCLRGGGLFVCSDEGYCAEDFHSEQRNKKLHSIDGSVAVTPRPDTCYDAGGVTFE